MPYLGRSSANPAFATSPPVITVYMALFFEILGALGVFIFGMKLMSESILKISGERLRAFMGSMTNNRFSGVLTGLFITCLVQSSSATTVMVVSFVHAQLLTLVQAIGVIMGANLGTTVTGWIVAFGFNFKLTAFAVPIVGIGVVLGFMKMARLKNTGNFLVGFGLLFLGLSLLKGAAPDVKSNPQWMEFVTDLNSFGFFSILIFILLGTLLTITVQSSSAAMVITFAMIANGWLNYHQGAAIVLGENIGTTITAYLASLTANSAAKRAARAHFLFNVIGVVWMLVLFYPFTSMVTGIYEASTHILPWEKLEARYDESLRLDTTNKLALFHSLFNFTNILLLVGFTPLLARTATWMVKEKKSRSGETQFRYINTGFLGAGELNFSEARSALSRLTDLSEDMFKKFVHIYNNPDVDLTPHVKEVDAMEDESNALTAELTEYLIQCSSDQMSESTRRAATSYIRVAAELEEICDCCHRMTTRAVRRYRKNRAISKEDEDDVVRFAELVEQIISFYRRRISSGISAADMETVISLDKQIDLNRSKLRKNSVRRMMRDGDSIKGELIYIDIVNTFERIGNHARNILQNLPQEEG